MGIWRRLASHAARCALPALALALPLAASAATPSPSQRCYQAKAPVTCLLDRARATLDRVAAPGDRAEATAELLYTYAATGTRDDSLLRLAMNLARQPKLAPRREMNLLYAIDLYQFSMQSPLADASYATATARFRALERRLRGRQRLDIYIGACSMLGWDDDFLERWLDFATETCNPTKLGRLRVDSAGDEAWLLALMPLAMTAAGDWDRYKATADVALSWLDSQDKAAMRKHDREARNFLDGLAVMMYSMNSIALQLFDEQDAAEGAAERSLQYLRRLEQRVGISARSTPLRRPVAESLFLVGRDKESSALVREMLAKIDADPHGRRLPLREQVAILALAANLEDLAEGADADNAAEDVKQT